MTRRTGRPSDGAGGTGCNLSRPGAWLDIEGRRTSNKFLKSVSSREMRGRNCRWWAGPWTHDDDHDGAAGDPHRRAEVAPDAPVRGLVARGLRQGRRGAAPVDERA